MNSSHAQALQSFARNLQWLLTVRFGVQMATVWLFFWGVVVLALRFFGVHNILWLTAGLLGVAPALLLAAWRAKKERASLSKIRASYDHLNECGGLIMSAETTDMSAWLGQLPEANAPKFRWHNGRALLFLSVSALFVAVALLLPQRLANFANRRPLEIGQIVQQLQAEVNVLKQEKILDIQKADDMQKQLSQLQNDALGYDPSKTWEALDHIKQADSDEAQQAAQEAINKTTSLTEAETVAKAMEQAGDSGMNATTASEAAQDLASMLNAAKLEDGVLGVKLPPGLLAGLSGLDKEQLQQLLQSLEANKSLLSMSISNLANLKMIDPSMLAKLQMAGLVADPSALADYLSNCTNAGDAAMLCLRLSKGGPGGGGPAAPMTWNTGASEQNLKFQEHALPPTAHLSQAQLVGVSKAAPELSSTEVAAQHGALDNTTANGGTARSQVILPEQRAAVQNYFKRNN